MRIPKWGFGMAPLKQKTLSKYSNSIRILHDFLEGTRPLNIEDIDQISECKGLFNRIIRQDQWDWMTVNIMFGLPEIMHIRSIASLLVDLRKHIKNGEDISITATGSRLICCNTLRYCKCFLGEFSCTKSNVDSGYIYLLSTKSEPDILKIGMTKRSVDERVKEINSATGVLFPYAARKVFRVNDSSTAEREIFQMLSDCRLRPDREFFRIDFYKAIRAIEDLLRNKKLFETFSGIVTWFDEKKGYGFISTDFFEEKIFFHISQVSKNVPRPIAIGTLLEFDLSFGPKGRVALSLNVLNVAV